MICEQTQNPPEPKTSTQLNLEDLEEPLVVVLNPQESKLPPEKTESLEAARKRKQREAMARWRRLNPNREKEIKRECNERRKLKLLDDPELLSISKERERKRSAKRLKNPEYKKKVNERLKEWREKNREIARMRVLKCWRKRMASMTSEERAEFNKKRCLKGKNLVAQRKWYHQNGDRIRSYFREYAKEKRKVDPQYSISQRLRARLHRGLKNQLGTKWHHTQDLIGCSYAEFMRHLESQFTEGMTWEKFLSGEIHIDHIVPICSFDLTLVENQRKAFGWENCRPLWAKDNLSKGAKILLFPAPQQTQTA